MNYDDYFAQGVALQNQGRWADAATVYGELAQVLTQTPAVHWNLGTVNKQMGNWSAALAAFKKATALDPTQRGADFNLGLCLLNLGQTAEALPHLLRAVEIEPNDYATHLNLALALSLLGRGLDAAPHADAALSLRPASLEAGVLRSRLRGQQATSTLPALWNDAPRAQALAAAILATVRPGDVVLDLAANGGQTALLALRAGAALVYSWSPNPAMAMATAALGEANALAGRLTVLTGPLPALNLPQAGQTADGASMAQPADVLIVDLPGAQQGGLPPLAPVREVAGRLLTPDARILPRRVRLFAALLESAPDGGTWAQALPPGPGMAAPAGLDGYDLTPLRDLMPDACPLDISTHPLDARLLSAPVLLADIDTAHLPPATPLRVKVEIEAGADGRLAGLLSWQEVDWGGAADGQPAAVWHNGPGTTAAIAPRLHRARQPTAVLRGEKVAALMHRDDAELWLTPQR